MARHSVRLFVLLPAAQYAHADDPCKAPDACSFPLDLGPIHSGTRGIEDIVNGAALDPQATGDTVIGIARNVLPGGQPTRGVIRRAPVPKPFAASLASRERPSALTTAQHPIANGTMNERGNAGIP